MKTKPARHEAIDEVSRTGRCKAKSYIDMDPEWTLVCFDENDNCLPTRSNFKLKKKPLCLNPSYLFPPRGCNQLKKSNTSQDLDQIKMQRSFRFSINTTSGNYDDPVKCDHIKPCSTNETPSQETFKRASSEYSGRLLHEMNYFTPRKDSPEDNLHGSPPLLMPRNNHTMKLADQYTTQVPSIPIFSLGHTK